MTSNVFTRRDLLEAHARLKDAIAAYRAMKKPRSFIFTPAERQQFLSARQDMDAARANLTRLQRRISIARKSNSPKSLQEVGTISVDDGVAKGYERKRNL